MNIILISLIVLGTIGIIAAIILFFVAKKFHVEEDPKISEIENVLPGANCGGCGFAGCKNFATACVSATELGDLRCPAGGDKAMSAIAEILGVTVAETKPKVAVLRCVGTCAVRPRTSHYNGVSSCAIAAATFAGETGCSFGCLGFGDCAKVCSFGGITINKETGLAEIDEDKCTSCGACVKVCPKGLLELRFKGPKSRRIYVSCANKDKGAKARKACTAACIGCGKCVKECAFGAITVENNVAYIDNNLCRLCKKCVAACPTGAIKALNFPVVKKDENI